MDTAKRKFKEVMQRWIDSYEAGDIDKIEFTEMALLTEMTLAEINEVLERVEGETADD